MYVCMCHGYTDETLQEACRGASSVEEVFERLGSDPECGQCIEFVRRLLTATDGVEQQPGDRPAAQARRSEDSGREDS